MPNCLRASTPTARKPHACQTCRVRIEPGEKYSRAVYLGDDGVYEWINCLPCDVLLADVWDWAGMPWEGVTDEEYVEWAHEHDGVSPHARAFLARLGCDCEHCAAASPGASTGGDE